MRSVSIYFFIYIMQDVVSAQCFIILKYHYYFFCQRIYFVVLSWLRKLVKLLITLKTISYTGHCKISVNVG